MVQLTDDLVDALDSEATRRGVSRSALIRDAINAYLSELRAGDIGARIVAGYQAHPPLTPDAWGEPGRLADAAAMDLVQRLDAEEDHEGHQEW